MCHVQWNSGEIFEYRKIDTFEYSIRKLQQYQKELTIPTSYLFHITVKNEI